MSLAIPIPGIKLGLANIVTVFALYALGPAQALLILTGRCLLGAVFAGNMNALIFSPAGGFSAMLVFRRSGPQLRPNRAACLTLGSNGPAVLSPAGSLPEWENGCGLFVPGTGATLFR